MPEQLSLSAKEIYKVLCPKCKKELEKLIENLINVKVEDVVNRTLGKGE